jgi:hypothetical protein
MLKVLIIIVVKMGMEEYPAAGIQWHHTSPK